MAGTSITDYHQSEKKKLGNGYNNEFIESVLFDHSVDNNNTTQMKQDDFGKDEIKAKRRSDSTH